MNDCTVIGIDLAKNSFALHGADDRGKPIFRRTLKRRQVLPFLKEQPPCKVAMECCSGSHFWGRQIRALGHEVMLIPANYVQPFVKRQKNDANDAAAIVEAASRETMRSVAVKSREIQAHATLYRTRSLFVRQRTMTSNAIRGLLHEFGIVIGRGFAALEKVREALTAEDLYLDTPEPLPELVIESVMSLFEHLDQFNDRIDECDAKMAEIAAEDTDAKRFQTVPGVGPITAFALLALVGDLTQFKNGREFAAWIGLTPKQHTTGGRDRLGHITKMGQRDLRTLLVQGGMTVIQKQLRHLDHQTPEIQLKLTTKPKKLNAVAHANKNARILWALSQHQEVYDPTRHHHLTVPSPAQEPTHA